MKLDGQTKKYRVMTHYSTNIFKKSKQTFSINVPKNY